MSGDDWDYGTMGIVSKQRYINKEKGCSQNIDIAGETYFQCLWQLESDMKFAIHEELGLEIGIFRGVGQRFTVGAGGSKRSD